MIQVLYNEKANNKRGFEGAKKIENYFEATEIIVERQSRKNSKITKIAISPPNNAFSTIVNTESSIGLPWSSEISITKPSMAFCSSLIKAFTSFTTSTVFASCIIGHLYVIVCA